MPVSGNEKLRMYADKLTNEQANAVVAMIESYLTALEEVIDDAFCMKLLEEAHQDTDEEYDDFDAFAERVKAGWT